MYPAKLKSKNPIKKHSEMSSCGKHLPDFRRAEKCLPAERPSDMEPEWLKGATEERDVRREDVQGGGLECRPV